MLIFVIMEFLKKKEFDSFKYEEIEHKKYMITNEQTISFRLFLKEDKTDDWRTIFCKGDKYGNRNLNVFISPYSTNINFRFSTNKKINDGFNSKLFLKSNNWYHILFILKKDSISLFIDKIEDTRFEITSNIIFNEDPLYIGAVPWSFGIVGFIEKFRIYQRSFDIEEIKKFDFFKIELKITDLGKSFQKLLQNHLFCDYTIVLNSFEIQCHQNILACRSKFFLKLFQSKMKDSNENSIILNEFEDKLMKILINFMYTDFLEIENCSNEDLIELMNIGKFLEIENISNLIEDKI